MPPSIVAAIFAAVTLDWTISIGNILTVATMVISAYVMLTNRIRAIETKVDAIWGWLTRQLPDIAQWPTPAPRRKGIVIEPPNEKPLP